MKYCLRMVVDLELMYRVFNKSSYSWILGDTIKCCICLAWSNIVANAGRAHSVINVIHFHHTMEWSLRIIDHLSCILSSQPLNIPLGYDFFLWKIFMLLIIAMKILLEKDFGIGEFVCEYIWHPFVKYGGYFLIIWFSHLLADYENQLLSDDLYRNVFIEGDHSSTDLCIRCGYVYERWGVEGVEGVGSNSSISIASRCTRRSYHIWSNGRIARVVRSRHLAFLRFQGETLWSVWGIFLNHIWATSGLYTISVQLLLRE